MKEEIKDEIIEKEIDAVINGLIIMHIGKLEKDINKIYNLIIAISVMLVLLTICLLIMRLGG